MKTALVAGAVAVVLGAAAPGALATTITVSTTSDALASDGHCSLREAITNANTGQAMFAGAGECPPAAGDDTIVLSAGRYDLSRAGRSENLNATGDLDILGTAPTTIVGAGAGATTIHAHGIDRVFHVLGIGRVTIRKVAIVGGRPAQGRQGDDVTSALMNPTGEAGAPGEDGGGILNEGELTVEDSAIQFNGAGDGGAGGAGIGQDGLSGASGTIAFSGTGGAGGRGGHGGGIMTTGTLKLIRTVVTENFAATGGFGGSGLGGDGGNASSSGAGNGGAAQGGLAGMGGEGGAVYATVGAAVEIDACTISGNSAGSGGRGGLALAGNGGDGTSGATVAGIGGEARGGNGGTGGAGGGLRVQGPLAVTRSLVSEDRAGSGGDGGPGTGGNGGDMATVNKSAGAGGDGIAGRGGSGGSGGGIQAFTDSLSIVNTTVTGNGSGTGGQGANGSGGHGGAGASVLSPNGAGGDGTGGGGGGGGPGGALRTDQGVLRHATISSNRLGAGGPGGDGSAGAAGTGPLPSGSAGTASDGAGGSASTGSAVFNIPPMPGSGTLWFVNTIVAANDLQSCFGPGIGDGGHNIEFPNASCPGAHVHPQLGPLADNGGPTWTQAIALGSPARDAVPATGASCAEVDQRGVTRPRGGACDIGAFEYALQEATTGDATGVSATGATLNGRVVPNGQSASYRFEYGTTGSYTGLTAPHDIGKGPSVPVSAAIGGLAASTTYHYRLVTTSAGGTVAGSDRTFTTAAAADGATDPAPVLVSASLSPKRFAVNRKGRAERAVGAVKRGTTFRYRLSEAATVTFAVQRLGPIRKSLRKRKRFRATAAAGANKHRFSGRIGRKPLAPGRYRVTLVARDAAGHASQPKRLRFRLVRG